MITSVISIKSIGRKAPCVQRTRAEPAPLRMDVAQFDIGVTHQPVATLGLEDTDWLADQRLADKDQLARPFDLAVAAYPAHRNVLAVVRIVDPLRIAPRRRLVPRGRRLLSQRLVRPLTVVDRAECIEAVAGPANWRPEALPSPD